MLHGRGISCSRISGLFSGRPCLPGHYEFRAQRPNRLYRPRRAALVTGLMLCRSDLSCHKAFASTQLEVRTAKGSSLVARLVTRFISPNRPTDSGEFVCQRDRRPVMPDALFKPQSPSLQSTQAAGVGSTQFFCARQHRPRPMNQKRSQVDVAPLCDAP